MEKIYYKVDENRLFDLLKQEAMLQALLYGGVDNWDWYGYATNDYINIYVNEHPDMLERGETADYIDFDDIAAYELIDWERVSNNAESDDLGG